MAVINEVGEEKDIHPKDKKTPGERLARWALAKDYGRDLLYSSPLFKSSEVRGDAIFWLGQSPNAENSAALRGLFGDLQDDEAREKLLFALSQNRSEANQRFLLERAKDRSLDTELRKSALFWAGQSGVPIRDLGEIYDSAGEDRALREQVIFTLSQRRDAAAVEKLIDIARKEPDRDLRKNAIFWLSQSRDPRAAKFLEDLINK